MWRLCQGWNRPRCLFAVSASPHALIYRRILPLKGAQTVDCNAGFPLNDGDVAGETVVRAVVIIEHCALAARHSLWQLFETSVENTSFLFPISIWCPQRTTTRLDRGRRCCRHVWDVSGVCVCVCVSDVRIMKGTYCMSVCVTVWKSTFYFTKSKR